MSDPIEEHIQNVQKLLDDGSVELSAETVSKLNYLLEELVIIRNQLMHIANKTDNPELNTAVRRINAVVKQVLSEVMGQ